VDREFGGQNLRWQQVAVVWGIGPGGARGRRPMMKASVWHFPHPMRKRSGAT
jgi:hypothetical protein